ncbi:MAG: D-inositol 3-phosphate glycosyltransferase [Candidatus Parcubacteria bacterium]
MKTRILMFGWEFPPHHSGGLGVACYGLTRALSELGLGISFVMPKKLEVGAPWVKMVFADMPDVQIKVVNSPVLPYSSGKSSVVGDPSRARIYGWNLMQEVANYSATGAAIASAEDFDIIYAHDWLSFGAGLAAKRETGKPLIVHVHATEFDRSGETGVNQDVYQLEKDGMEGADVIIAVSEYTKQILVKHYGISEQKIRVVYNGIDEATLPQGSGALPRLRALKAAGYKLVLFLGRITMQKGPDYFVRVAKRVVSKDPKVMFILSGSGDMEEQMIDMAARLGISDKILFTGFVGGAERHEVYVAADLFVMPSISEPFGISTLEAMKLGVPVLISKQSGISEVVKHALKVDFWDVEEMANKILGLVSHPGVKETLSENAVREAERLTWIDAAKKVDNIIKEVVARV